MLGGRMVACALGLLLAVWVFLPSAAGQPVSLVSCHLLRGALPVAGLWPCLVYPAQSIYSLIFCCRRMESFMFLLYSLLFLCNSLSYC